MVKIELQYLGDLRVQATHPSGTTLVTDAPVDNQGKGESFSPTDLVATSLPACMATIMGIVAKRHDWDLAGMTMSSEKHMTAQAPRRIEKLVVDFHIPAALDAVARKTLKNAALTCPVYRSLHPDITLEISFDWNGDREAVSHED